MPMYFERVSEKPDRVDAGNTVRGGYAYCSSSVCAVCRKLWRLCRRKRSVRHLLDYGVATGRLEGDIETVILRTESCPLAFMHLLTLPLKR